MSCSNCQCKSRASSLDSVIQTAKQEAAADTSRLVRSQRIAVTCALLLIISFPIGMLGVLEMARQERIRHPMQPYVITMVRPDGTTQAQLPVFSRGVPFSSGEHILRLNEEGYKETVTTLPAGWWFHVTNNTTPEKE